MKPTPSPGPERIGSIILTHPERVVFPEMGVSKLEIARYYEAVLPVLMPHIEKRGLALLRCPDGIGNPCFFQKHLPQHLSRGVRSIGDALVVETADGLLSLIQFGAIELHTWGACAPALDQPDRITIDLDPDPGLTWLVVAEGARRVRLLLKKVGLESHLKTTGGKGLHVVVPLRPTCDWATVKAFAKGIANHLATFVPGRFTATLSKSAREGRIFVDYLRNAGGATAVSAYSVRARPGAPVSIPIPWSALEQTEDLRGRYFNIRNALKMPVDAWSSDAFHPQSLTDERIASLAQAKVPIL